MALTGLQEVRWDSYVMLMALDDAVAFLHTSILTEAQPCQLLMRWKG